MARRTVLTSRQRAALFALPQREADLLRHYTLSDEDLQNIGARRRPSNKLGFALQLCVLRYPGRLLAPGEFVPPAVVDFIGRQLDLDGDELADYAVRSETRHEHLAELRRLYGFRSFAGGAAHELWDRLREEAPRSQSNEDLVRRFIEACRHTRTILPATTTIERICADALVDAERRIEARIAERVPPGLRRDLEYLLEETVDAGVTRFVWLRQFEPGNNSADANRLLDGLRRRVGAVSRRRGGGDPRPDRRQNVSRSRAYLRRAARGRDGRGPRGAPGVRRTGDGADRREGHRRDARRGDRGPSRMGGSRRPCRKGGRAREHGRVGPVEPRVGRLQPLPPLHAANAAHVGHRGVAGSQAVAGSRRRPAQRRHGAADRLSCGRIRSGAGCCAANPITAFGETAVLFHLRDAFRAGDVWLARSRRYGDIRKALLSAPAVADADRSLPIPASPHDWLAERRFALDEGLRRLAAAARARVIAGGSIEDSMLRVERTEGAVPDGTADLVADLYRRMPDARITDILIEVDDATRFTEAFTHLRTGSPCRDRIGLLNVLLAEGINLGLRKMAEATTTHGFWELMRIARWHVEG